MKTKAIISVLLLIIMLCLTACEPGAASVSPSPSPVGLSGASPDASPGNTPSDNPDSAVLSAKIAAVYDGTLLLSGADESAGSLYTLGLSGITLTGTDGSAITADALKPGMTVDILFSGLIMESYPAQLGDPVSLSVTKEGDDLVSFYLRLIRDIYDIDPGLNGGIEMLALDLTAIENLSPSDKSALVYMLAQDIGKVPLSEDEQGQLHVFESDYEALVDEGLISDMYFEKGILVTFRDMTFEQDSFKFSLEKWRSGLGAYYFVDCEAELNDGVWSYTIGSEVIS